MLLKLELKKAFWNRWFFLSLGIGLICSVLSFIYNLSKYSVENRFYDVYGMSPYKNHEVYVLTAFSYWIGGDFYSLGSVVFYFIFPLLAVLAFGWSYREEKRVGYHKMLISKTSRRTYYLSKSIALFISGGTVFVLPQLINLVMTMCVIPMRLPLVEGSMYYGIFNGFLAPLFYSHPLVYVFGYLLLDFVFAGLLANLTLFIAEFIKNQWIIVVLPFIFLLAFEQFLRLLYRFEAFRNISAEFSPLTFLHAQGGGLRGDAFIIGVWLFVLFISWIVYFIWVRKRDILE